MPAIRRKLTKNQSHAAQQTMPLDDGTVTTSIMLTMIQTLIPLRLKTVEKALLAEVLGISPAHALFAWTNTLSWYGGDHHAA